MTQLPKVNIYTDGSCDVNPGPGGWAALLRWPNREEVLSGHSPDTTNNRMELSAALQALESLNEASQVSLFTDSEYLKRGVDEWMDNWRARGWKRKKGVLANVDLWKALDQAIQRHEISWQWIKGHAGHRDNQRVDRLAREAMFKNKTTV